MQASFLESNPMSPASPVISRLMAHGNHMLSVLKVPQWLAQDNWDSLRGFEEAFKNGIKFIVQYST